jgi:predicted nucleic acid-binding protein
MARFLLDTDIVSNLRKRRPHPGLIAWLGSMPRDSVSMCTATVAEIQCGISRVQNPSAASLVQDWLDALLRNGHPKMVDFDARSAQLLGRMWATPALNNFVINDPRSRKAKTGADLTIAACAIASGLIVVTGNVADFAEIDAVFPLPGILNPCAQHPS